MEIRRWITKDFPVVTKGALVREVLNKMRMFSVDSCLVVDEGGHFMGIVHKNDLSSLDLEEPVDSVVFLPDFYVHESEEIIHALLFFLENQEPYLPVIDDEMKLKGVVSLHDFLEAMVEALAMDSPGIRIHLSLEDRPGALKRVVDVLAENSLNILSVITLRRRDKERDVVIKVDARDKNTIEELLKSYGIRYEKLIEEEGF